MHERIQCILLRYIALLLLTVLIIHDLFVPSAIMDMIACLHAGYACFNRVFPFLFRIFVTYGRLWKFLTRLNVELF